MITDPQVLYLGRWVDKAHFKAFVYNSTGERLAHNYDEFMELISSGVWFDEKSKVPKAHIKEFEKVVEIKRGRKCRSQQQR